MAVAVLSSHYQWVLRTGNVLSHSVVNKPLVYNLLGKSLTFRGAVYEAQEILKNHRCTDPICDTHLWKVRHELDMAKLRVRQLEKELDANGIKAKNLK